MPLHLDRSANLIGTRSRLSNILNSLESLYTIPDNFQVMTKEELDAIDRILNIVSNRVNEDVIGLNEIKKYNRDKDIEKLL